jgi:hypothetical protein
MEPLALALRSSLKVTTMLPARRRRRRRALHSWLKPAATVTERTQKAGL